jgi:hypothetical protein
MDSAKIRLRANLAADHYALYEDLLAGMPVKEAGIKYDYSDANVYQIKSRAERRLVALAKVVREKTE